MSPRSTNHNIVHGGAVQVNGAVYSVVLPTFIVVQFLLVDFDFDLIGFILCLRLVEKW
ncbi:hypothetical protein FB451DRAFT_1413224 [Mycena latifolia]|nr:hypothetical protein FB451DRAFT_1413224 [Mycena latifolia]